MVLGDRGVAGVGKEMPKSIGIIGLGAVASTLAAALDRQQHPYSLWGRQGRFRGEIGFHGWGEARVLSGGVSDSNKSVNTSSARLVFVAVKSIDLEVALESVCSDLDSGDVVIPVCNGDVDGIREKFSMRYPQLRWRTGVCLFGTSDLEHPRFAELLRASKSQLIQVSGEECKEEYHKGGGEGHAKKSSVAHGPLKLFDSVYRSCYELCSHNSQVIWGACDGGEEIIDVERHIVAHDELDFFKFDQQARFAVRKKWLFNTVMNSLCAVNRHSKNGRLLDDMGILKSVFSEAVLLSKYLQECGETHIDTERKAELWASHSVLWGELLEFISATAENENSMAKDIRLGRRTESEFLAGLAMEYDGFYHLKELHRKIIGK